MANNDRRSTHQIDFVRHDIFSRQKPAQAAPSTSLELLMGKDLQAKFDGTTTASSMLPKYKVEACEKKSNLANLDSIYLSSGDQFNSETTSKSAYKGEKSERRGLEKYVDNITGVNETRLWMTENRSQFTDKGYNGRESIRPQVFGSHLYFRRGSSTKQSVYGSEFLKHENVGQLESYRPKPSVMMVEKDDRTWETTHNAGLPSYVGSMPPRSIPPLGGGLHLSGLKFKGQSDFQANFTIPIGYESRKPAEVATDTPEMYCLDGNFDGRTTKETMSNASLLNLPGSKRELIRFPTEKRIPWENRYWGDKPPTTTNKDSYVEWKNYERRTPIVDPTTLGAQEENRSFQTESSSSFIDRGYAKRETVHPPAGRHLEEGKMNARTVYQEMFSGYDSKRYPPAVKCEAALSVSVAPLGDHRDWSTNHLDTYPHHTSYERTKSINPAQDTSVFWRN